MFLRLTEIVCEDMGSAGQPRTLLLAIDAIDAVEEAGDDRLEILTDAGERKTIAGTMDQLCAALERLADTEELVESLS
jgi:hypothetical protein